MRLILCFCIGLLPYARIFTQPTHCTQKLKQGHEKLKSNNPLAALQCAEDALQTCPEAFDLIYLKAESQRALVNHEDAILSYARALEILEKQPFQDSLCVVICSKLANSAMRSSQYTKGIAAMDKALVLQERQTGENSSEMTKLLVRYCELAINAPDIDPKPIIERTKNAIKNATVPSPNAESELYLQMGIQYIDKGCSLPPTDAAIAQAYFAEADAFFEAALAVQSPNLLEQKKIQGDCYFVIGESYQLRKQNDLAESCFLKAIALRTAVFGPRGEPTMWCRSNLARTMFPQGKYEAAMALADTFLQMAAYERGNLSKCSYLQQAMGVMDHKLKSAYQLCLQNNSKEHCEAAVQLCIETLELIDYQISKIERNDLKNRFVATAAGMYGTIANILYFDNSTASRERLFQISERSKSYLLNNVQVERSAMKFAHVPQTLVDQERSLQQQINLLEKDLALTYQQAGTNPAVRAIKYRELANAYHGYDSLKAKIYQDYPEYFNLAMDKKLIDVQTAQQILQDGQTMLEYFTNADFLYVFIVNKNSYEIDRQPYTPELMAQIRQFHSSIYQFHTAESVSDDLYQYCADQYSSAGHALFQRIIAPYLSKCLPELLIVPDGLLNFVPFEALLTTAPTKSTRFNTHAYLLHDFTINYAYSATLLRENQQKSHSKESQKFLGIAPAFAPSQTAVRSKDGNDRQHLRPLLHNASEVKEIQKILGGVVIEGEAATKANFMSAAPHYKIIHLATHAQSVDKIGDFSFLAFSQDNSSDGVTLFSKEIYNLSLHADLVVLSACQTGVGELRKGEGVISLARAFMYAGTKSVVTTLWSVDDAKSKELMVEFYRQLQMGQRKDAALRAAKLNYLQRFSGEAAHPFYWAGFIGLGDMTKI